LVQQSGKVGNPAPKVGDKMPDGTIYAGISPDTNKPMYTTWADAPLARSFNSAKDYARTLNRQYAHDHDDWRVPTKNELNVLFNNRAAIGGFNESGCDSDGRYWSSTQYCKSVAWGQCFSEGYQGAGSIYTDSAVRCVR
jgi:hypothetical protein